MDTDQFRPGIDHTGVVWQVGNDLDLQFFICHDVREIRQLDGKIISGNFAERFHHQASIVSLVDFDVVSDITYPVAHMHRPGDIDRLIRNEAVLFGRSDRDAGLRLVVEDEGGFAVRAYGRHYGTDHIQGFFTD